jgi:predicted AAA+ superfamily ATPase
MFRKFTQKLKKWETDKTREPMMVVGARQVGKTWLIKEFCKENYKDYVYVNFEQDPTMESVFAGSLNPQVIIENLEIVTGKSIDPDVAIFFDEIQKCERAIMSLKYFCEGDTNYRVLCAGSLLGVKLNRYDSSFPVGKVKMEEMFPMDFEEFLIAMDEDKLRGRIEAACNSMQPLPEAVHDRALKLYQCYLYVGGMPRCVTDFLNKECKITDFDRSIQENLLMAYAADMNKYTVSAAESIKIGEVFASVPRQLARENPKFKYKDVRPNANKRDFYGALDWLVAAKLVYKVVKVEYPQSPLKVYTDEGMFKVYLSDVGLLACAAGIALKDIQPDTENLYKGILTENYVVQELNSRGISTFYYKPDAGMEIDLLLDVNGSIVPMEVKSGRHVRSTSLKNYDEKYHPSEMIRLSYKNFTVTDRLKSVPLYALFALF